jgi:hypothetical protein
VKCQAAASTATIRGEIVIATATRLIRGKSCVIFGVVRKTAKCPLEETCTLQMMVQEPKRCGICSAVKKQPRAVFPP